MGYGLWTDIMHSGACLALHRQHLPLPRMSSYTNASVFCITNSHKGFTQGLALSEHPVVGICSRCQRWGLPGWHRQSK